MMVIAFELAGHRYLAINGGPHFKFNEALSLQIEGDSQAEIDLPANRLVRTVGHGQTATQWEYRPN